MSSKSSKPNKFTYDKPINKQTERTVSRSVLRRLNHQMEAKAKETASMPEQILEHKKEHFRRK